ncbi:MAG TPA: GtrA family protein [Terriglobales bacterium]|nr:GtrA family protein [Terriglobales bacterium]
MTRLFSARSRLVKFFLVGGIGVGVQLGALAGLRAMKVNYLVATGLAVESAVVHNFLWHQRFTWADRILRRKTGRQRTMGQLLRFQLSNGGISLAGNLLLMRVLAGFAGLPMWLASLLSIALCAGGNFLASDQWVFLSDGTWRSVAVKPESGAGSSPGLAFPHQHQGALRKGHVDEGSGNPQGKP